MTTNFNMRHSAACGRTTDRPRFASLGCLVASAASVVGLTLTSPREVIPCPNPSALLPFQPSSMTSAQLAAVSYLARYAGRTHVLYSFQLRQWFAWCETNGLDPLVGVHRAHVELYIRQLGECGLMDSSVNTMMHAVRGFFRFAHIDGLIGADPAVYARLPKIHHVRTGLLVASRAALQILVDPGVAINTDGSAATPRSS